MLTKTLTGNRRHRVATSIFRAPIMILQVQERVEGYDAAMDLDINQTVWRDAAAEDLTATEVAA